jgi:hypothetical protein
VRSVLLVLAVIRKAEMRSMDRGTMQGVGDYSKDANRYSRAQSPLLSNGLIPALLLIGSAATRQIETARLRLFLRRAPATSTRLIVRSTNQGLRRKGAEFCVRHFLARPVSRTDLKTIIDPRGCPLEALNSVPIISASSRRPPGVPYLEEMGEWPAAKSAVSCYSRTGQGKHQIYPRHRW